MILKIKDGNSKDLLKQLYEISDTELGIVNIINFYI